MFTPEILALYQKAQAEQEPTVKEQLVADIGRSFMAGVEAYDENVVEEIHALVEEAAQAHMKYMAAVLRVGRVVIRNLRNEEAGRAHTHINTEEPSGSNKKQPVH